MDFQLKVSRRKKMKLKPEELGYVPKNSREIFQPLTQRRNLDKSRVTTRKSRTTEDHNPTDEKRLSEVTWRLYRGLRGAGGLKWTRLKNLLVSSETRENKIHFTIHGSDVTDLIRE